MLKTITSLQNSIIKDLNLIKNKKDIIKLNSCFVESEKVITDLSTSNFEIKKLFVVVNKQKKFEKLIKKYESITYLITDEIANKISETVTNSGIFAEVELSQNDNFDYKKNMLVLDNLQDPNNLGAIIRSALAFNINQIIMIGGVFPYLAKVIRASMGYVFAINFKFLSFEELEILTKELSLNLISADLNGTSLAEFKKTMPFGLVIGNEGNGVSDLISKIVKHTVTIPMNSQVESLNASISASILMYELNK